MNGFGLCRTGTATLALLAAGGCAGLLTEQAGPGRTELFSARGNVVTQVDSEPPQRALFKWNRHLDPDGSEHDSLVVLSPTGTALFKVENGPDRLVLRSAHGQELADDAARTRLHNETGWRIPLKEASFWLRCKPHPELSSFESVNFKGEKRIHQSGWEILCASYDEVGRPTRLRLENPHSVLIVSIEEWAD